MTGLPSSRAEEMPEDFRDQVSSVLGRLLGPSDSTVLEYAESSSFGDTYLTLQCGNLRLRVVRERGKVFADFASAVEPQNWFDAAIVAELFGDSSVASFIRAEGGILLGRFAQFLEHHLVDLERMFTAEMYPATKVELNRLERESVKRRFGV